MDKDKSIIATNTRVNELNGTGRELAGHEQFELSILTEYCEGKLMDKAGELMVDALLNSKRDDRKRSIHNIYKAIQFYLDNNISELISLDNIAKHIKTQYSDHPKPSTKQSIIQISGMSEYVKLAKQRVKKTGELKAPERKAFDEVQKLAELSPETLAEELVQLKNQIKGMRNNEARLRSIINKGLTIYSSDDSGDQERKLEGSQGISKSEQRDVLENVFGTLSDSYGFDFVDDEGKVRMLDSEQNVVADSNSMSSLLKALGLSVDDFMAYVE